MIASLRRSGLDPVRQALLFGDARDSISITLQIFFQFSTDIAAA